MTSDGKTWHFDQGPNVACITCRAVMDGDPVLVVTHYEDDHSWAFLDGRIIDPTDALLVAMSEIVVVHPELRTISDLPPDWTASRAIASAPWARHQDTD